LEIDNREFLKGAFPHIQNGNQLPLAIDQALNPSMEMKETAEKYRQKYFYMLDGNASKRFITTMEKLFREGGHENGV
jgi:hypothetical protein